jgi:hypothetical protein
VVLALAEILGAEEFRQADDLRPLLGRLANFVDGVTKVVVRLRRARHLD